MSEIRPTTSEEPASEPAALDSSTSSTLVDDKPRSKRARIAVDLGSGSEDEGDDSSAARSRRKTVVSRSSASAAMPSTPRGRNKSGSGSGSGSGSTPGKGRKKLDPNRPPAPSTIMTPERREANRLAAERSRVRRAERASILEVMAKGLASENEQLKERLRGLISMNVVTEDTWKGVGLDLVDLVAAPSEQFDSGRRSRRRIKQENQDADQEQNQDNDANSTADDGAGARKEGSATLRDEALAVSGQDQASQIDPALANESTSAPVNHTNDSNAAETTQIQYQALMDLAAASQAQNALSNLADVAEQQQKDQNETDVRNDAHQDESEAALGQSNDSAIHQSGELGLEDQTNDRQEENNGVESKPDLPAPIVRQSLNQEMELHFRSEIERLQVELEDKERLLHEPHSADNADETPMEDAEIQWEEQRSSLVRQSAQLDAELVMLHELANGLKEAVQAREAVNNALKDRAQALEEEDLVEEDLVADHEGAEMGEKRSRTEVVKKSKEEVEKALIDVKKHVNLMLSYYNPSFIPVEIPTAEAFTIPEKFEPIPLPQPQKRGRPANPNAKPAPTPRKVRPPKPPAQPRKPRPSVSGRSRKSVARRQSEQDGENTDTQSDREEGADSSRKSGRSRGKKTETQTRRYRVEGEDNVIYIEDRSIRADGTGEVVKVSTRKAYQPRPASKAGRKRFSSTVDGGEDSQSTSIQNAEASHAHGQAHEYMEASNLYEAHLADQDEGGLEPLPGQDEADVSAYPEAAQANLSYGQVSTLLAAAGVSEQHQDYGHMVVDDGQAHLEEQYADYISSVDAAQ